MHFVPTEHSLKFLILCSQAVRSFLLHIMCGYQCDIAVSENDTREVI